MTRIAQFEIKRSSLLSSDGELKTGDSEALDSGGSDLGDLDTGHRSLLERLPEWVETYKKMVLTRIFEQKAVNLQRTGRLGIYAPALGQEAIPVTIGQAMRSEDVLCPYYREFGAQFQRGVSMEDTLRVWGGSEQGNACGGEDLPVCITLASQCLHAAGVARAFQIRGQKRVAVAVCGDGATSRGDFYEAINIAGVWDLPLVLVVNNNQWAISMPRAHQTRASTLAQKAIAAGIPAHQVDGNDAIALRLALDDALAKARGGGGPTLIEAMTYRINDHSTIDDARRYRDGAEVEAARAQDPIDRLGKFLTSQDAWGSEEEAAWKKDCADRVKAAVDAYLSTPDEDPAAMARHTFATWPAPLADQLQELIDD